MHLVARAKAGRHPFEDPAAAWWFWWRLRQRFPNIAAACLMPNHLHLLVRSNRPELDRRRLGVLLAGFSRHLGQRSLWQKVPSPARIPDRKHLLRQVRYVHLNPCRDGLVDDPLRWPWSTHRGLLGAAMDPWVTPATLAGALGRATRGFGAWLHHYVSSDPSVSVSGTPPPAGLKAALERRPEVPAERRPEVPAEWRPEVPVERGAGVALERRSEALAEPRLEVPAERSAGVALERGPEGSAERGAGAAAVNPSSLAEVAPGAAIIEAAQQVAERLPTLTQGVLAAVSAAPYPWLVMRCRRSIVAVSTNVAAANAEVAAVLGVSPRRVQQLRREPIAPADHACVLRCLADPRLLFDEHAAWPLLHMAGLRLPR